MHLCARFPRLLLAALALSLLSLAAHAEIGVVQFSIGEVSLVRGGAAPSAASKGTLINEGDTVIVGPSASAQLKMVDGGVLALRPETQMKFDEYRWSGREDGKERGLMSLLKGGFRTITGAIGRLNKSAYRVTTPTATVGIRGTDHEIVHIPVPPGPPRAGAPAPGTYDKVNVGAATITALGVTIVVNPNQVGHAPPQSTPRILPVIPGFMRATPPTRTVQQAPGQGQQSQEGQTQQADTGNTRTTATGDSTSSVRTSSVVDNGSEMASASSTALQSGNTTSNTTTGMGGPAPNANGSTQGGSSTTNASSTTVPVLITNSSGTTANLTSQTTSTGTGQTTSISGGSSSSSFTSTAADTAAQGAASAVATLSGLVSANSSLVSQTLPAGTPAAVTAARSAFSNAAALTVNAAPVSGSVSTAATTASLAQAQATAAAAVYTANGSFADPAIATPALNAMTSANSLVQSNNTLVANAATTAGTQQTTFNNAVASGNSLNTSIATSLTAISNATTSLSTLGLSSSSTASGLLSTAQSAATAAQSAATLALSYKNAGNTTQADAQIAIAQQQQLIAQNALIGATAIISGVAAASSAQQLAGVSTDTGTTLFGFANSATNAANAANTAIAQTNAAVSTPTPSAANVLQTQAAVVTANAPLAQYSNPAWANPPGTTPRGMSFASGGRPVTGGLEQVVFQQQGPASNVAYVLDQNKNLVTERNSTAVTALGVGAASSPKNTVKSFSANTSSFGQTDATATITGATAGSEGVYAAADGTAYMGRWTGGQIDVNAVANAISMGTGGLVWGLGLEPVLPGIARASAGLLTENTYVHYAQQITGTLGFTKVYNTTPFDASGHTGTLTSATLSANFTSQTANASVGVAFTGGRNSNLTGSVTGVPITQSGFDASPTSGFSPTINCTGACAPGYVGNISGGFTGTSTVSGALLGYTFRSNETTGAFGDLVSGGVVFSANGTPTAGQNLSFVNNASVRHLVFYPVTAADNSVYFASINNGSGVTSANTNYLFDASGNLVRVQETPYTLFDNAVAVTPANVAVPGTTNNAANHPVEMSFSGTAAETYDANSLIGLRFGRYQGGTVTVGDLANNLTYSDALGNASALWAVGRTVPGSSLSVLTGQWHYSRIANGSSPGFATTPADNWGNLGVLLDARLEVNFSALTVNPGLRVGMTATGNGGLSGSVLLSAYAEDVAISGGSFNVGSSDANPLRVSCQLAGCGSGFGGRLVGNFTSLSANGSTADGAMFRYTLSVPTSSDYISGLVAFQKGSEVVPTNVGKSVYTSYYYWDPLVSRTFSTTDIFRSTSYSGLKATSTFDSNGNLLSASQGGNSVTIDTSSAVSSQVSATLANGISFGRYSGASTAANPSATGLMLTGVDSGTSFTNRQTVGVYQWIAGPNIWPIFASMVTPGTATYSVIGNSSPTDQNGVAGTFNSASLAVDFNRQSVNTSLNVTMSSGNNWVATANNILLDGSGTFSAGTSGGLYAHNALTVNINGSSIGFGSINGQLNGVLMNGASLAYTLAGNPVSGHEHVNGVIAFGNPSFSANTAATPLDSLQPYLIKLTARGTNAGFDSNTGLNSTANPAAAIDSKYLTRTSIVALDPTRTIFNGNELVAFDAESVAVSVNGTCPANCSTTEFPTRLSINAAGSAASGNLPAMPAITGTAATVLESGTDITTGISWGRYSNGSFAIVDRVTGASVGSGNATLGNINHYIVSSVQSGPVVLPTSGTFNYTLVGNTSPTDHQGNVGTLNAASLVANFTAQTVNVGVNATVNGKTFDAAASGVNILATTGFDVSKTLTGTSSLSVNCTSGCSAAQLTAGTAGSITGAFTGPTGNGAAIAYSFNAGGITTGSLGGIGVTIGGVAAFKR